VSDDEETRDAIGELPGVLLGCAAGITDSFITDLHDGKIDKRDRDQMFEALQGAAALSLGGSAPLIAQQLERCADALERIANALEGRDDDGRR